MSNLWDRIKIEDQYSPNYLDRLPVIVTSGDGVFLFDQFKNKYFDFIGGYTSVAFGHCHPRLISSAIDQIRKLTLTTRILYNDKVAEFVERICNNLGYEKVIMMNSGTEACETAIKLVREFAYEVKGIPEQQAKIVVMQNNFMGRAFGAMSGSSDNFLYKHFGPLLSGFINIPFNNLTSLQDIIKDPNICALFLEPIQGHAGIILPEKGYLKQVSKICKDNNVLLVVDEIQTGVGRTGRFLACDYEDVKPDLLILGKALTGGLSALSLVLGPSHIIDLLGFGTHGSTYGGNPYSCAIAFEALDILEEEDLISNALSMGIFFRNEISKINIGFIKEIRGIGLLNAIKFQDDIDIKDLAIKLSINNVLVSKVNDNSLRFTPPLIITKRQMEEAVSRIADVLMQYNT